MNEEKYIEEQVGRRNPFTVPEGYFDTFADQLMASLPERQPRTKYVWLRPLRYAAAVVCVLAMGAMTWFALSSSPESVSLSRQKLFRCRVMSPSMRLPIMP